ncbi:hypothetical protein VMCG_02305 [Cytospora schulzeri]|uniref:Uncharacterized protein n=1 Tax=Cytospora schulzeri TaxID=448051 RepID=A0A423X120_9PEZI|nr:hypothetical protein VMCG_02305 [Valsa malicola]
MPFKIRLEALSDHGLDGLISARPPRLLAGGGISSLPKVFAHVYNIADTKQRKISRKPAILDLRSCMANHEFWGMQGQRTAVITSYFPQINVPQLRAPLEIRKPAALVNTDFSRPRSQRDNRRPASHPHPLRSHCPWPGHSRTRTTRPRRRAHLFSQAEKEALQKLLPTIEEEAEGDEDKGSDDIHGLASASGPDLVPSIVISNYDSILGSDGLGNPNGPTKMEIWVPEAAHRNEESTATYPYPCWDIDGGEIQDFVRGRLVI